MEASGSKGTVRQAVEASVASAVKAGNLSRTDNAAPIAGILKLADVMDDPDWKGDSTTPSAFLRYCDALGLVPSAGLAAPKKTGDIEELKQHAQAVTHARDRRKPA